MKKVLLFATAFWLVATTSLAQIIDFKVNIEFAEWKDTLIFLAANHGDALTVIDTLRTDTKGRLRQGLELHAGEYAMVCPDRSWHTLLVKDRHIKAQVTNGIIEYEKSLENKLYSAFKSIQDSIDRIQKIILAQPSKPSTYEKALERLEAKRTVFISLNKTAIDKTLAGKIIKATCLPFDMGYLQLHPAASSWAKKNYFAHMDLSDPIWWYTSLFREKVRFYMTQVVAQNPDSLIEAMRELLEKSKPAAANFRGILDTWLRQAARSKRPELEVLFVFLVREYLSAGACYWLDEYEIQRFTAQVDFLRNQLLGQVPPNLNVQAPEGDELAYWDKRQAFQLLLFWDPNCAHCQVEVPQYHEVYTKYKDKGFSVVAIYIEQNADAWKSYIAQEGLDWTNVADLENTGNLREAFIIGETPTVLLLDHTGKIVKKRLNPNQLDAFLMQELP
ncbi:MAG: TlpA family protein disulfide reductase [Bacteroidetes bacterium]|jgi:thiol-disulfide isomerase/thioredoxin|nr:TlpA family protein disulfide reductase [Bacteroidota bacterium]